MCGVLIMALRDAVLNGIGGLEGVYAFSVKHLGTGEAFSVNGGEALPTASVFKVPLVVELYRQVEGGEVSLDQRYILRDADKVPGSGVLRELTEGLEITLSDLTTLMMIVSDNTATDIILGIVGAERVNSAMRGLGLNETAISASCRDIIFAGVGGSDLPDEERTLARYEELAADARRRGGFSGKTRNNVSTTDEMTALLGLIAEGRAAGRGSCEAILGLMAKCQTGEVRIAKYLPRDAVRVCHKEGTRLRLRNDVGVVTLLGSGERWALSCFTNEVGDVNAAEEAIAVVSKNVYDYFMARA
jgi:beta-lactamase class A